MQQAERAFQWGGAGGGERLHWGPPGLGVRGKGLGAVAYRVLKVSDKVIFEKRSEEIRAGGHEDYWEKHVLARGLGKCSGPEVGILRLSQGGQSGCVEGKGEWGRGQIRTCHQPQ